MALVVQAPSASAADQFTGTDTTPPTFTIVSPARGEFVSGSAQVTISGAADDAESGVSRVEVNGQQATFNGNQWSIPSTLDFGTNIFTLRVADNAGNEAHTSWSALYSQTYLPATELVPDSAASRLSERALSQIAPVVINQIVESGALQEAITSAVETLSRGRVTVSQLSFGTPTTTVGLVQGGIRTIIDIPSLDVQATFSGFTVRLSATNVHVDAILLISVGNGQFVVTMPERPTVQLTGFASQPSFALRGLQAIVEGALAAAIQTALPPALDSALDATTQPQPFTFPGGTVTVQTVPRSLSIDPTAFRSSGDTSVSAPASPNVRPGPGSISRNGATTNPPVFTGLHDLGLAVREDLLNQALYAAWQSGAGHVRVDQAFLTRFGINLPIPLDASFLVPFFPALESLVPPGGGPMPMAFDLDPLLPPVVKLGPSPQPLTAQLGELHMTIAADFSGQGTYQPVLTVALHCETSVGPALLGEELRLTFGDPVRFSAALHENPLGLPQPDIDQFLRVLAPLCVGLAGSLIPALPLPASPFGLPHVQAVEIRQDGPGADFLTIEGDL